MDIESWRSEWSPGSCPWLVYVQGGRKFLTNLICPELKHCQMTSFHATLFRTFWDKSRHLVRATSLPENLENLCLLVPSPLGLAEMTDRHTRHACLAIQLSLFFRVFSEAKARLWCDRHWRQVGISDLASWREGNRTMKNVFNWLLVEISFVFVSVMFSLWKTFVLAEHFHFGTKLGRFDWSVRRRSDELQTENNQNSLWLVSGSKSQRICEIGSPFLEETQILRFYLCSPVVFQSSTNVPGFVSSAWYCVSVRCECQRSWQCTPPWLGCWMQRTTMQAERFSDFMVFCWLELSPVWLDPINHNSDT